MVDQVDPDQQTRRQQSPAAIRTENGVGRGSARLAGVLFDVDGTLVDSNDAHARAWVEALKQFGHDVLFDRVRRLIGMGGDKLLAETAGIDAESDEGKAIQKRRLEIFTERYLPHLSPCRGARALVQSIRADGLKIVVASSAKADELRPLLEHAQVADLIDDTTSSDDAPRSKPDPDIVSAALRRGGLSAERVVMVGDTPYDVEAAGRSGVAVIALRCGGWDDDGLRGAIAIYDDPQHLLEHYDSSPLGAR